MTRDTRLSHLDSEYCQAREAPTRARGPSGSPDHGPSPITSMSAESLQRIISTMGSHRGFLGV